MLLLAFLNYKIPSSKLYPFIWMRVLFLKYFYLLDKLLNQESDFSHT